MKLLRKFLKRYHFRQIAVYFLTCCLCSNMSSSVALAGPKGKGVARGNPHVNINPHANPHSANAFVPGNIRVNPAGIIVGSGGSTINSSVANQSVTLISRNVTNTGAIRGPKGHFTMLIGDMLLLGQPGSNVVIEINPLAANNLVPGGGIVLAAGDAFSGAFANLGSLSTSLPVPDPIGAKGPNPVHGGSHANKGDGNPGGGNDKGHWGEGNKGNGVGNIWTGNQGRGVGEGMAGGYRPEPPPPPEPPEPPVDNGEINIQSAPLHRETGETAEEQEFEEGGCPALMNWLTDELGIEEETQIFVDNSFIYSTDIQPCEMCARLRDAAIILKDPNGTSVAALAHVVNEFIAPDAPPSEEQMALIAAAFAGHTDDGTHYAVAGRWLDALVEYVGILNNNMGWSPDNSVTLVIDKYCGPIIESGDATLIAYIEVCLGVLTVPHSKSNYRTFPESRNPRPLGDQANTGHTGTGDSIAHAYTASTYVLGGLGIFGAVGGAIFVGLVKLKRNK